MGTILLMVLPVFLVMSVGYISVKSRYMNLDFSNDLNNFAIKIAIPCLLFKSMYKLNIDQAFYPSLIVAFYSGAIIAFFTGIFLTYKIWNRKPEAAVAAGFCALFSNTLFLGLPIAEYSFGSEVLPPILGIISLHSFLMYITGTLTMEFAKNSAISAKNIFFLSGKLITTNPLVISIIAGIGCNLFVIKIPLFILNTVDIISVSAIPVALVSIGAVLTRYKIKSELSETFTLCFLSLIVHPLIVLCITYILLGVSKNLVQATVIIAAMPSGINAYVFASMYNRSLGLSASVILVSTLVSIITISGWIILLKEL